MRATAPVLFAVLAAACGAGRYGYARYYEPLDDEAPFAGAPEPTYLDVQRDPAGFSGRLIGWFGVVREAIPQDDGTVLVRMSQRVHQHRHLCSGRSDGTCRVTVSERPGGSFAVRVRLRPGPDSEGVNRLQWESLLKIYGRVTGEYDADGGPILEVEYYRHWPRGQWVDTTAQVTMRR
ncbi:MAG: hypothetical protein QME96_15170 [Myxococcota bacterium]|nr:hypothetical protein [Myxococcota bacterium]